MSADVASSLKNWSSSEGSNAPAGTTAISTNLDENLRQIQAVVRAGLATKGSDIASGSTTDIGAVDGLMHDITGTTTITSFGTVSSGIWKILKYEGALTLTHNASSLILLGGVNRTTANGDTQIVISEGSGNWREIAYFKVSGLPLIGDNTDSFFRVVGSSDATKKLAFEVDGLTAATTRTITVPDASFTLPSFATIAAKGDIPGATAAGALGTLTVGADATSLVADSSQTTGLAWRAKPSYGTSGSLTGAAIAITGVPAYIKRITFFGSGASTNGTAGITCQLRDSGGLENSGYTGATSEMAGTVSTANYSSAFSISNSVAAANTYNFRFVLELVDAATNTWSFASQVGGNNTAVTRHGMGLKSLSAALDGFSVIAGGDSFDAGSYYYFME